LFPARDYISGDLFQISRCRRCSLVRTLPRPHSAESERYYPSEYYGDDRRYVFPVDYALNLLQARRSRRIHDFNARRAGAVLDVGCGRGLLLHQLRTLGWKVTGTELSNRAARHAREALHLDVHVGELTNLDFEAQSFDAVVLWHVLEHVDNPAVLLHEVSRLLRPDGIVLVAVPNFGSIEGKLWRAHWFHLDVPRHLTHFTPNSLANVLEAERLKTERTSYFSPEYDYFSFIQSALNGVGLRQNSLYDRLRAGPAKLVGRIDRKDGHQNLIAHLILVPLLALLSLFFVPTAGLLGRGATVIVYARKV
jgi:2-polyprenyl-3-methyl-5-hydroxy-6-metoxy-1,4-benzoquinol methylase